MQTAKPEAVKVPAWSAVCALCGVEKACGVGKGVSEAFKLSLGGVVAFIGALTGAKAIDD